MNRIPFVAQLLIAFTVGAAITGFVMDRQIAQAEKQRASDMNYFRECHEAFITEYPQSQFKGATNDYVAEMRRACP